MAFNMKEPRLKWRLATELVRPAMGEDRDLEPGYCNPVSQRDIVIRLLRTIRIRVSRPAARTAPSRSYAA
jgi:hypothetical protein